jgi:hypothetical protein
MLRNAHLTGEQDVLTSLRHRSVRCCNNEDSTIHLRSAGDHVLDIVSVPRAVNVRIVTALDVAAVLALAVVDLVLNVSGVDRDSASLLLRSAVDLIISPRTFALPASGCSDRYLVIAAVNVVLPWSTWPIVPMFT